MKIWRMLAALCMISALVFCFAACGAAPAQPSTEPTDETVDATTDATEETEPLVDPETFKDFIGTWYADGSSASYRIVIKKDATWSFQSPSEEALMSGTVFVNVNNKAITLYDPEGSQAFDIKLEEAGTLYAEVYTESVMEMLTTNYFLNEVTNSEPAYTPFNENDSVVDMPVEEAPTDEQTPSEEEVVEEEVVD